MALLCILLSLGTAAAFQKPAVPSALPRAATVLRARTAAAFASGWKVNDLPANAMLEARLELDASSDEWMTKEIDVEIPRSLEAPGLGILLEEFGNSGDGRGLTLVDGLVDGGNAAACGADLLPGDTITGAAGISIEALDYDGTLDALGGLPPAPAPARLVVKRLVRVPAIMARVMFPPDEGRPDETVRLRPGRQIRGTLLKQGIDMGPCGDDLQCCLTCGMLVRKGMALLEPMKTQEAQMLKSEPSWRLTCRAVCVPCDEDQEMVIRIRPPTENMLRPRENKIWE